MATSHLLMIWDWTHPPPSHSLTPTSRDECVKDDLGSIEEITKLSFPEGQQLWALNAHSIFKPQDSLFWQRAVANLRARKRIRHWCAWDIWEEPAKVKHHQDTNLLRGGGRGREHGSHSSPFLCKRRPTAQCHWHTWRKSGQRGEDIGIQPFKNFFKNKLCRARKWHSGRVLA